MVDWNLAVPFHDYRTDGDRVVINNQWVQWHMCSHLQCLDVVYDECDVTYVCMQVYFRMKECTQIVIKHSWSAILLISFTFLLQQKYEDCGWSRKVKWHWLALFSVKQRGEINVIHVTRERSLCWLCDSWLSATYEDCMSDWPFVSPWDLICTFGYL